MSFELFLALRYFTTRRRRPLARATGAAAVVSLALGVAALLLVWAAGRGWRETVTEKILRGTPHIVIARRNGGPWSDIAVYAAQLRRTAGVTSVQATFYANAILNGPMGAAYGVLQGWAADDRAAQDALQRALIAGTLPNPNAPQDAVLGAELLERLGLRLGERAEIVTADTLNNEATTQRRQIIIVGVARSGWFDADATAIYLPLASAARLTSTGAANNFSNTLPNALKVTVTDAYAAHTQAAQLRILLGEACRVTDWQETHQALFTALAWERRAGTLLVALLMTLAGLNILAALVLVVAERRTEIAVLVALGARSRSIMLIFLVEGLLIGLCGTLCGTVLGVFLAVAGNRYQWLKVPAQAFGVDAVPFALQLVDVLQIISLGLFLSLLATLWPAWAATRMQPADALQES